MEKSWSNAAYATDQNGNAGAGDHQNNTDKTETAAYDTLASPDAITFTEGRTADSFNFSPPTFSEDDLKNPDSLYSDLQPHLMINGNTREQPATISLG